MMSRLPKSAPLTFMEAFTGLWLTLSFIAILCIVPALGLSFKTNPNEVKHPVDATLIDAHPYSQSTGKHSSELRWQGRFQLLDGRTIDQDIDGFFYKNFVTGGEKPIKSWVAVSGRQLWKEDPAWVQWKNGFYISFFFGLVGLLVGMMLTCLCPHRH